MENRSIPIYSEYDPAVIPWQLKVVADIKYKYDYSIGTHEVLLSGAIGSGKSVLAAHLIIDHALRFPNSRIGIGRRSLPDLKATIFRTILEHIDDENVKPYVDKVLETSAQVYLTNGSTIEGVSWSDKRWAKLRSRVYSFFAFEEAIENEHDSLQAFVEIRQRVGRVPHVSENIILYCTNPGSPASHLYKYFFDEKQPTKHIYFSLTEQNPFLPKSYVEQLKRDLPFKEAERQIFGKWVEIDRERLYYAYNPDVNFKNTDYIIDPKIPVSIAWDFNIGIGKPMSCILSQYNRPTDTFHFFDEVVIHGSRTEDILEELAARGYFEYVNVMWEIHGDATGGSRTTNSKWSNYDVIDQFLKLYRSKLDPLLKVRHKLLIPTQNPPIRERHNILNAYCKNAKGDVRLFIYKKCKIAHEGMRLTSLKKGAEYIEDDSKEYQHVTTAIGYRVVYTSQNKVIIKGGNF
jgi:hypothetical protein